MGVLCGPNKHILQEVQDHSRYIYTYFCQNCPVEFDLTAEEIERWSAREAALDHLLRIHLLAAEIQVAAEGS